MNDLSRRAILGGGLALAAGAFFGIDQARPATVRADGADGAVLGSVAGAPGLPAGFRDVFSSRFVQAGDVRLHAVVGGEGPPLLLVHGWPQTWYQWRLIMPTLAKHFQVIAVDQRGMGLSDKPDGGYDTGTQAADLVALMEALGHRRFSMVGADTGMLIGYALAADHPDRLERLAVAEAVIPGLTPSPPLFGPGSAGPRLWHIPFNQTPDINEQLVAGREDLFFGWQFTRKAAKPLPQEAIDHYVAMIATVPGALRGSFGVYRAFDETVAQNLRRRASRLSLPVLGLAGANSVGEGVRATLAPVADDLRVVIVPETGHWIVEESPEAVLAALTDFLRT